MQKSSHKYSGKENSRKATEFKRPWRPQSVTGRETGGVCPHCGKGVNTGDAVCSSCGRSLIGDKCSFCGASVRPNAKFCTGCGQSREGVRCPECGTLNSRNFCRRCNAPLTPNGLKFREEALADPKFRAVEARAEELAALHRRIEELHTSPGSMLSEADRNLLDEYAGLLSSIGATMSAGHEVPIAPEEDSTDAEPSYSFNMLSLDELMKAYHEKAEEMDRALAGMVPPPDFTPEQQRDYYAARKVATFETEVELVGYSPMMWKCNLCGCMHLTPPECARPELGGTWVHVSPEDYIADHPELTVKSVKINIT